jgi:hypothetical protein
MGSIWKADQGLPRGGGDVVERPTLRAEQAHPADRLRREESGRVYGLRVRLGGADGRALGNLRRFISSMYLHLNGS